MLDRLQEEVRDGELGSEYLVEHDNLNKGVRDCR